MKMCIGFWAGMGAGIVAGAVAGMLLPCGRDPMKTQVGKSIHKLGVARGPRRGQHRLRDALSARAEGFGPPLF